MISDIEDYGYDEAEEKLTDWDNEPSVEALKKDYDDARSHHTYNVSKIQTWLHNLNVTGPARIKKRKGRSTIVPKLIRKQAEWRYASLSEPFLSTDTMFKISPRGWKDKQAAYENGLILNYQINHNINKVKFIDDYVRTAVNEGTVVVRVGWEFQEEEQEVEVPVLQVQTPAMELQAPGVEAQMEPLQITMRKENQMVTVVNQPTLDICEYENVIIDPTCDGDLDQANFVIYRFETSLSELKKLGIYKNLDAIDIEGNDIMSEPNDFEGETKTFNFQDKPRKKFVAYEYWGYWDIDDTGTTKPFVATWVGDVMIRMESNPFPDGKLPFVLVQYLPKKDNIYGEPDGELLEDNQKVLGAVTRGMVDIMGRSAAGQKGVRVDALDITNRRRWDEGEDYEFQAHIDPRQAFYDHNYPEIPNSAQFMVQLQQMEAESLTGVKAFQTGLSGDALGRTATGVKGALDAAAKREMGILRRLSDGLKKVALKIVAMNGEFLSDEEIIRITDEEFVTINRENLPGSFDIVLDISSVEMDNVKAQELAFMLQTMGNNMPPGLSQRILSDIARLRKMPELAKELRDYEPEPDPMKQQLAQLEMMKLQAEIEKLKSEVRENLSEGQLDQAKAQHELAKARHFSSQADMTDLNFLEEKDGVKHLRDIEKQGAQARANLQLKEREAQLKTEGDFFKEMTRRGMNPPTQGRPTNEQ